MGKLQIRGGSGTVPALAPREPFFDGNDLHIGKLDGSGNQKIGASNRSGLKVYNPIMTEMYDGVINDVTVDSDGNVYVGGNFGNNNWMRKFDKYGDEIKYPDFTPSVSSEVYALHAVANGIIFGKNDGDFVGKMGFDGSWDNDFILSMDAPVVGIAVDAAGNIYLADFASNVKKFTPEGVEDESFIFYDPDGCHDLFIHGGYLYATIHPAAQNPKIIRLSLSTGLVDENFEIADFGTNAQLWRLLVVEDSLFVGGAFSADAHKNQFLRKYDLTGEIDFSFTPTWFTPCFGLSLLDGQLLATDSFPVGSSPCGVFLLDIATGLPVQIYVDDLRLNPGDILVCNQHGQIAKLPAPSAASILCCDGAGSIPYWGATPSHA